MAPRCASWAASVAIGVTACAAKDTCECLNWAPLYMTKTNPSDAYARALCGEGLEWMPGRQPPTDLSQIWSAPYWMGFSYHEFCASFYMRMNNNYCVNTGMVEYGTQGFEGETWCYVSNECTELNGGFRVPDKKDFYFGPAFLNGAFATQIKQAYETLGLGKVVKRDVSVKLCTKEKDTRLRDMEPLKVLQLAKDQDSVIGFVTKIAYHRLMPPQYAWDKVKDVVLKNDVQKMPATLKKAIEANEPIIIDVDPEGHTHQRIVKGKELYELDNACGASGCGGREWPFRRGRDLGEL